MNLPKAVNYAAGWNQSNLTRAGEWEALRIAQFGAMLPSQQVLFRVVLHYLYYSAILVGILPFGANNARRFVWSKAQLTWSIAVGLGTMLAVGFSFQRIVTLIAYPSMDVVRHLIYYEFVIRFGILTSCYVLIWANIRQLKACGNNAAIIFEKLKRFKVPWMDKKLIWYGVMKIVLVDITMCCLFAINFRFNMKSDPVPAFERVMNVYAVFVAAQVSNMCLITLFLSAYLFRAINWKIKVIIGTLCDWDVESSCLVPNKSGAAKICADLILLSKLHFKTTEVTHTIFRIFGISLTLINLNQFLVITSRIYFVYVSAVQELKHEFQITWNRYLNSVLYVTFEVVHLLYLVSTSARSTRRAQKTFVLLTEFFGCDLDKSVDKQFQNFSSGLLLRNQNITLCGLYRLDFSLLFSMVAAIALKLIVLIQLQLSD